MVPLIVLMVWIGVYPNMFLRKMTPSVQQLLMVVQNGGERGKMMVTSGGPRSSAARPPRTAALHGARR